MKNQIALSLSTLLLVAADANAQRFNIDVSSASGTPASSYGAASAQAGVWNSISPSVPLAATPLVDLNGAATGVTMEIATGPLGYNGLGAYNWNNPNTTGDDQALLDDIIDVGGGFSSVNSGLQVTVKGLAAGTYDIYTYAFGPDNYLPGNGGFAWQTLVTVPGATTGQQTCGVLDWGGAYVETETYVRHTVTVAAGSDLDVLLEADIVSLGFGAFNGMQIVEAAVDGTAYCFGDGTGAFCPCAAFGGAGGGCLNTAGTGAVLAGSGAATVSADTLVLTVTGGVPNKPGLFFQGNNQIATPIGDGIICATGSVVRYDVQFFDGTGTVSNTGFGVNATPGSTKNYQFWYRDTGNTCGGGFNFSNGWSQVWN